MVMKRLMAMMLAAMLILFAAPALALGGEVPYWRIVDTMLNLREVAHGDFMSIKGVPANVQEDARAWTEAIDDTPDLVVRLDVYDTAHVAQYRAIFKSEHPMVSYEAQSTGVGEIMNTAMVVAAYENIRPESMYYRMGDVVNALGYRELYADPDAEDGCVLYIVLYEGAEPVFLLTNVENGAVCLTPYIIPCMALSECESYPEVVMWFMSWGCPISGAEVRPE